MRREIDDDEVRGIRKGNEIGIDVERGILSMICLSLVSLTLLLVLVGV